MTDQNDELLNMLNSAKKKNEDEKAAAKKAREDEEERKNQEKKTRKETFDLTYKQRVRPAMKLVKEKLNESDEKGVAKLMTKAQYEEFQKSNVRKNLVAPAYIEIISYDIPEIKSPIEIISYSTEEYSGLNISIRYDGAYTSQDSLQFKVEEIPEQEDLAKSIIKKYIDMRWQKQGGSSRKM